MTALHDDPRVRRGMERQLELRRRLLDDGARPIGWKLGLGTAAAMEQHGTTAPLVGFLTDRGLREPGSELAIGGWGKPTAEPEIAVHVAPTSRPTATATRSPPRSAASASRSSSSTSAAASVEEILAGDIFHRHVVLGPRDAARRRSATLRGAIVHGDEGSDVDDPLALVGDPVDALAHLATHLAAFGETVRAGDVLITGSIVPALPVAPGDAAATTGSSRSASSTLAFVGVAAGPAPRLYSASPRADGGIGRRARLRAWSGITGWRFESSSAHRESPAQAGLSRPEPGATCPSTLSDGQHWSKHGRQTTRDHGVLIMRKLIAWAFHVLATGRWRSARPLARRP